ncbi:NYN domain-containing protein [Paradevosia shaoguanensis]|uniref:NYN domain-containing protein n=1 Tax=Paradevosia shaoguanensis TaxID=1335043 RepID=UPI0019344D69|nr:NYN domain-containing protein [Paradevosia shaoguanensis]
MKLAVLVDAENTPAKSFDFIAAQVQPLRDVGIFRLFGDFASPSLAAWRQVAVRHGLEPILQGSGGKGKNSTDIAMVIHAMDILHSGLFDAICLVSTDRDFVGLARRLRAGGLQVFGIGRAGVENGLESVADRYFHLPSVMPSPTRSPVAPELPAFLGHIASEHGVNGWILLAEAANALKQASPGLAERYLGKGRFLKTLRAADLISERKSARGLEIRPRLVVVASKSVG